MGFALLVLSAKLFFGMTPTCYVIWPRRPKYLEGWERAVKIIDLARTTLLVYQDKNNKMSATATHFIFNIQMNHKQILVMDLFPTLGACGHRMSVWMLLSSSDSSSGLRASGQSLYCRICLLDGRAFRLEVFQGWPIYWYSDKILQCLRVWVSDVWFDPVLSLNTVSGLKKLW